MTDPLGVSAALAAALILGLPFVQASTPRPAEERDLVDFVDAHTRDALALLERVVNINSGTQNFEGVREVGRVFPRNYALGFTTRWVDGAAFKRAGHLVADHPGSGPRILLIGHLDTVFEKDSPFRSSSGIDERTARGPGIIDMKGGDVVMVCGAEGAARDRGAASMNVVVVMTGDEEDSGDPLSAGEGGARGRGKGARIRHWIRRRPGDPKLAVTARRGPDWLEGDA